MGKEISQGWTVESLLNFIRKYEINLAIEGLEIDYDNYSIFSKASTEDSFVYSQPEPD